MRRPMQLARLREQPIAKIAQDLGISEGYLHRSQELANDGLEVAVACRALKVPRSDYYEWRAGPPRVVTSRTPT